MTPLQWAHLSRQIDPTVDITVQSNDPWVFDHTSNMCEFFTNKDIVSNVAQQPQHFYLWLCENMDLVRAVDKILAAEVIKPEWQAALAIGMKVVQTNAEAIAKLAKTSRQLSANLRAVFEDYPSDPTEMNVEKMPGVQFVPHNTAHTMPLVISMEQNAKSRPRQLHAFALQLYILRYIYEETMNKILQHQCARTLRLNLVEYLMSQFQRTIHLMLKSMYQRVGVQVKGEIAPPRIMWDASIVARIVGKEDKGRGKMKQEEERELLKTVARKNKWVTYNSEIGKMCKTHVGNALAALVRTLTFNTNRMDYREKGDTSSPFFVQPQADIYPLNEKPEMFERFLHLRAKHIEKLKVQRHTEKAKGKPVMVVVPLLSSLRPQDLVWSDSDLESESKSEGMDVDFEDVPSDNDLPRLCTPQWKGKEVACRRKISEGKTDEGKTEVGDKDTVMIDDKDEQTDGMEDSEGADLSQGVEDDEDAEEDAEDAEEGAEEDTEEDADAAGSPDKDKDEAADAHGSQGAPGNVHSGEDATAPPPSSESSALFDAVLMAHAPYRDDVLMGDAVGGRLACDLHWRAVMSGAQSSVRDSVQCDVFVEHPPVGGLDTETAAAVYPLRSDVCVKMSTLICAIAVYPLIRTHDVHGRSTVSAHTSGLSAHTPGYSVGHTNLAQAIYASHDSLSAGDKQRTP
ncbi:hypothetical protein BC628DRAFT_1424017 [Trametes gibbosa]|nr:hypothetical protein BC628DRAFT_1424017 [Trametes gibbosa]